MKKNKNILLRGGHKLKYISGDLWEFVPAEEWMNDYIQAIPNEDKQGYISVDCSGLGMPLLLGCQVSDYKIVGMFNTSGLLEDDNNDIDHIIIAMKPIHKESINDLEKGDKLYVVTPDDDLGAEFEEYDFEKVTEDPAEALHYIDINCRTKDGNRVVFTIDRKHTKFMLDSVYGVNTVYHDNNYVYRRIFSNREYAQKYAYDIIQDKIEKFKETQRKIMVQ